MSKNQNLVLISVWKYMLLYPVGENFIHISVQGCHLAIMHDNPLKQSSAAFLAPGTVFGEDSFHGQG